MSDTPQTIAARLLADAQLLVTALGATPPPPPPPTTQRAPIATPAALDAALAAATPGTEIVLDQKLVYPAPLRVSTPVTLRTAAPGAGRIARDVPSPRFLNGITIAAPEVTLAEIAVSCADPTQTGITVAAARAVLRRVLVLGDPVKGLKRGIAGNGANLTLVDSYIADCFGPYPGNDCQAFCAWDAPGPFLIQNNYLEGSTETLMFGGSDASSAGNIPSDIVIRGNVITKNPAWQAKAISVKNVLELKCARRVLIEQNVISRAWGGKGQDGYLLMLTVRNQNGRAPWSTVQDVTIRDNDLAEGAAAINLLGLDNNQPSERMARISIEGNRFTALDPVRYTGSSKMILVDGAPSDVTIDGNTFAGTNLTSVLYFAGGAAYQQFKVTNNRWPKTKYGVFGTNASIGQAWAQYVASGTLSNTEG